MARWENGNGQLSPESYFKIQSVDWLSDGFVIEEHKNNSESMSQENLETAATFVLRRLLHQKINSLSKKQLEKLYKMIELLEE